MLRIIDWFLRRLYGDAPPRWRVRRAIEIYYTQQNKRFTPRIEASAFMYSDGFSIKDIAQSSDVTRERVRQQLWKAVSLGR